MVYLNQYHLGVIIDFLNNLYFFSKSFYIDKCVSATIENIYDRDGKGTYFATSDVSAMWNADAAAARDTEGIALLSKKIAPSFFEQLLFLVIIDTHKIFLRF